MLTLQHKLYVQLAPYSDSADAMLNATRELDGRAIPHKELHVTVLHIGKLERLFCAIRSLSAISEVHFLTTADALQRTLEDIKVRYESYPYALNPIRFDRFGINNTVLVLRLEPTDMLKVLHEESLAALKMFLFRCGIKDTDSFIKSNDSLRHSYELTPHVSLSRSFRQELLPEWQPAVSPLIFSLMNITYDS